MTIQSTDAVLIEALEDESLTNGQLLDLYAERAELWFRESMRQEVQIDLLEGELTALIDIMQETAATLIKEAMASKRALVGGEKPET